MGEWRKEESFSDYTVLYDWILPRTSVTRKNHQISIKVA